MHIPLEKLPAKLQEEIKRYLEADDFRTAKFMRDQYETYLHQKEQKIIKKLRLNNYNRARSKEAALISE